MFIPYVHTTNSITLIIDGIPSSISKDHKNFKLVLNKLDKSLYTSSEEALNDVSFVTAFNNTLTNSNAFYMDYSTDTPRVAIKVDGYPYALPFELQEEVLRINSAVGNLSPLAKFVVKLARNPYKDVADQLFRFIQVCGLTLTEDGDFLAYKNVRSDFKDIYSGTMDNSVGATVRMPRHAVEKDPDKTCAAGLHFAAWDYLSSYGKGLKTVIVKISPTDVVSIPSDYNNMKGRACEYTILKEVEQPEELKYQVVYSIYSDDDDYDDDDYHDDEDDDEDGYKYI